MNEVLLYNPYYFLFAKIENILDTSKKNRGYFHILEATAYFTTTFTLFSPILTIAIEPAENWIRNIVSVPLCPCAQHFYIVRKQN